MLTPITNVPILLLGGPVSLSDTKEGYKKKEGDYLSRVLPVAYVVRHGNRAWTRSGQHTNLTDLPLALDGERNAQRLGKRLKEMKVECEMSLGKFLSSPRFRTWAARAHFLRVSPSLLALCEEISNLQGCSSVGSSHAYKMAGSSCRDQEKGGEVK